MTLYHFGNCVALIYAPYHMVYKFSGISEYGTLSRCMQAGGLFFLTQLVKMLLLATFFPDTDAAHSHGQYDMFLEILKATVDFADLIGLHVALSLVPGKGHAKVITTALGWAAAEVVGERGVSVWVGARGAEFSWRHLRQAAGANLALVQHAAVAALLWLRTRSDLPSALRVPVRAALLVTPYAPLVVSSLAARETRALLLRAVYTVAVSALALTSYTLHAAHSSYS